MKRTLLDAVMVACQKCDTIPDLNYGGCCRFACRLGRKLADLGIPVWGIAGGGDNYSGTSPSKVRRNIKNTLDLGEWADNGVELNHVGLRFKYKGKYYQLDSTGVTRVQPMLQDYRVLPGKFTIAELESFADDTYYWNDWYDVKNNKKIDKYIKEAFA